MESSHSNDAAARFPAEAGRPRLLDELGARVRRLGSSLRTWGVCRLGAALRPHQPQTAPARNGGLRWRPSCLAWRRRDGWRRRRRIRHWRRCCSCTARCRGCSCRGLTAWCGPGVRNACKWCRRAKRWRTCSRLWTGAQQATRYADSAFVQEEAAAPCVLAHRRDPRCRVSTSAAWLRRIVRDGARGRCSCAVRGSVPCCRAPTPASVPDRSVSPATAARAGSWR